MISPAPINIRELARTKWASSGLTDSTATGHLKFEALTKDQVRSLGPTFIYAGALKIPYFTPEGQLSKFFRIRYLEPLPGFAGLSVKPRRYAQAAGTLSEVYLPPLFEQSWAAILNDHTATLLITEGELKAACACDRGFPTIGLGGVDVWRSSKRGLPMLPVLAKTVWKDRLVYIVYDSDAISNPNVMRAQHHLADELQEQGARVRIASLPAGPSGSKQGLDDFLVIRGTEGPRALQDLLEQTPGLSESVALWDMNEEVVYVQDPGLIVVRHKNSKMKPQAFVSHAYSNRHYFEEKVAKGGKGINMVKKPLADRWLEWEARAELIRVTYKPGAPQITSESEWNDWPGWGCEPETGDTGPWEWLLDFLFNDKPEEREWFEQWLAYPIQHPGIKMLSSAVIWGVAQGTGKTLVGHTMLKIYGANGIEIDDSDLEGDYNSWAVNKQFVMGDEITGSESRARANKLKGMITRDQFQVKVKYVPEYTLPDCVNYLFTAQGPDAFFLADEDRRYFIHEIVGDPAPIEKYRAYDKWLKQDGGPSALFAHLLEVDLAGFDPKAPALKTAARSAMIQDGKSDLAAWCSALRAEPERLLLHLGAKAAAECEVFTATQLLSAYDPSGQTRVTAPGMGRELKRARFRSVSELPVKTSAGFQRLVAVRNPEKWVGVRPKDVAEHWDSFFGPGAGRF